MPGRSTGMICRSIRTTQRDGWVDAKGSFLAGVGAGRVYQLLGKKEPGVRDFPTIETTLIDSDVGFRQHTSGHTPAPNWPVFITFADRYPGNGASSAQAALR